MEELVKPLCVYRKWFPPLRKLSQSKTDKSEKENRSGSKKSDRKSKSPSTETCTDTNAINDDDVEDDVEMPPPMKPISEALLKGKEENDTQKNASLPSNSTADIEEMEKFVRERLVPSDRSISVETNDPAQLADKVEKAKRSRHSVLQELIETEESYIRDMSCVFDGYLDTINNPDPKIEKLTRPESFCEDRKKLLFKHIKPIYEFHRDIFYNVLKECVANVSKMGQLLASQERKFSTYYTPYCQNKRISEYILNENIAYLEDIRKYKEYKLSLRDVLIKPVQRLSKYKLLLENLLKYTKVIGDKDDICSIMKAIEVVERINRSTNDCMDLESIQGFDLKDHTPGMLLKHGSISCARVNAESNESVEKLKMYSYHLYVFEQLVLLCEEQNKRHSFSQTTYVYKGHIPMNKMSFEKLNKPLVFVLKSTDTDPSKKLYKFCCLAADADEQLSWQIQFEELLDSRKNLMRALQYPQQYSSDALQKRESKNDLCGRKSDK